MGNGIHVSTRLPDLDLLLVIGVRAVLAGTVLLPQQDERHVTDNRLWSILPLKAIVRGRRGRSVMQLSSNSPLAPVTFIHTQNAGLSAVSETLKPSTFASTFAFASGMSL